jgi:hypothetical protein
MQNWFDRKPQIKETESMRKRKGSNIARLIAVPLVFWTAFISTPQAAGPSQAECVIQVIADRAKDSIKYGLAQFVQLVNDTPYPKPSSLATDPTNPNAWTQEEVAKLHQLIKKDRQELLGRAEKLARLLTAAITPTFDPSQISFGEALGFQEDLWIKVAAFLNYNADTIATHCTAQNNILLQCTTEDEEHMYKQQASSPRNLKQKLQQHTEQAMLKHGDEYDEIIRLINPSYPHRTVTHREFTQWLDQQP